MKDANDKAIAEEGKTGMAGGGGKRKAAADVDAGAGAKQAKKPKKATKEIGVKVEDADEAEEIWKRPHSGEAFAERFKVAYMNRSA